MAMTDDNQHEIILAQARFWRNVWALVVGWAWYMTYITASPIMAISSAVAALYMRGYHRVVLSLSNLPTETEQ